jgi:hypothetical protein
MKIINLDSDIPDCFTHLVGFGEGSHGGFDEVTLSSSRTLRLSYELLVITRLHGSRATYSNNPGYRPFATFAYRLGQQRYRYLGL